ncbi:exodeoxyribonuclease VII small subunit [Legionella impletisoli]|uniref:Exodeoxyribonuclease 7 small subunit n=1 Tax=Legionella impletisoli TaxID=343510 RepID=A0A917JSV3_9GAMM|nr:exodeoxyribonuclease VII small subunit [Legionella impletisoli]GGI85304.1 exodeoxyribonuclease 7 small subunit [Legionella impletisoli]
MTKPAQFEKSLSELQKIVAQLEKGDLTLEESLKQFEKGINLAKKCEDALNQAELKIEALSESKSAPSDEVDE